MLGVDWRAHGYVGLLDSVKLVTTLGDDVASTFDCVAPSILIGLVLSTLVGVATGPPC